LDSRLTDCAPLAVALEHVTSSASACASRFVRASWANIRDKLATGLLDAARARADPDRVNAR
jgi:hypothetical protein